MNNDIWKHAVSELIRHIESSNSSKESVNELYTDLCDVLFQEMDNFLDYNNVHVSTKTRCLKTTNHIGIRANYSMEEYA